MNDTMTLDQYIAVFSDIGAQIGDELDNLAEELDKAPDGTQHQVVMNIMVGVAQVQALQAIAVGIRDLIQKENS
jgi:hypothetical protein